MMAAPARQISAGEVHVWRVGLGDGANVALLSDDERARAARLRFDRDRARYVGARSALRTILGAYLGEPPERLAFEYGLAGKPALAGSAGWLRFNVAHSADLALVVVRRGGELGVDVERIRPAPDALEIAARYFAQPACEALSHAQGGERDRAFFRLWTRFEAALKATGAGLAGAPPRPGASVCDLDLGDEYVGAVAVEPPTGPLAITALGWE